MVVWRFPSSPDRALSTWEIDRNAATAPPSVEDLANFERRMQHLRSKPIFDTLGRHTAELVANRNVGDKLEDAA